MSLPIDTRRIDAPLVKAFNSEVASDRRDQPGQICRNRDSTGGHAVLDQPLPIAVAPHAPMPHTWRDFVSDHAE